MEGESNAGDSRKATGLGAEKQPIADHQPLKNF